MATVTHNWGTSANFDEGQFKQYLRVIAANANPVYATTAALNPGPAVYNTLVWPHTLTGASNLALTVDSVAVAVSSIIIVKDQANTAHNGIYKVTVIGSGAAVWVMQRHDHLFTPIKRWTYSITTAGTANANKGYYFANQVNVLGTDSVTITQSTLIAPVCKYVTEVPLPNSPIYATDTITAGSNTTLTLVGTVVALNDRILVRKEAAPERNGLYYCSTAGSGAVPWVLTRMTGWNAAAQPILAQSTFTCNAVASTNHMYYNSVWYLNTEVTTVGTTAWDLRTCPGAFNSGAVTFLRESTVITINSDSQYGDNQPLGSLTSSTLARGTGLTIDATETWWAPYDSGTGTVPYWEIYGTVDVTRSAVGVARYLGIWDVYMNYVNPETTMPTEGYIKFRKLETSVTLTDNDVLTLSNGATVTINSSTGGQWGWLHIGARAAAVQSHLTDYTFTTNGQWFYLDNITGFSGQFIRSPFKDQITAVQVETGSGTDIYEWWLSAGVSGTPTNTTLKWGNVSGVMTDSRAKYFGATQSGAIRFAPRGIFPEQYQDCKYVTAAILPNTPTYTVNTNATLVAGANSTLTVDGSVVALNERVLVKTQATASQNGIYYCSDAGSGSTPWKLTRATDFDNNDRIQEGLRSVLVTAGTSANIGRQFTLTSTVGVDTNNIAFSNQTVIFEIPEVKLATTAALTVTYDNTYQRLTNNTTLAALTIDSVAVALNDRILVKDQASALQNGIYKVTNIGSGSVAWTMVREYEFSTQYQPIPKNAWTRVLLGTTNTRTCWVLDAAVNTIGTDNVTWVSGGTGWDFEPCRVVVTYELPNIPTYSSAGSGTLTATTGTAATNIRPYAALVLDGVTLAVNDRVLVTRTGGTGNANDGIYYVSDTGSSTTPWILTRATGMTHGTTNIWYNQRVFITDGNFKNTTWTLQRTIATVGTGSASNWVRWGLGEPNTEWINCRVATVTVLPNSPTYAAATGILTAGANSTLTIDGTVIALADYVLVKDQVTTAQNGIYRCSAAGSGAAPWTLTRAGDVTAGQLGMNETARALAGYSAIGKYVGARVLYGNTTTTTMRNTYWYLSAPITANFNTSPAVTFIRGCPASQMKSVEWVGIAVLTIGTYTAVNQITSATAIDGCPAASMIVGDRVCLTLLTSTLQQGIYECITAGATPTYARVRGFNSIAGSTSATGDGAIPAGLWVSVTPGSHSITGASSGNDTARTLTATYYLVGTSIPAFPQCAGYGGYQPSAGARVRIPNIYCSIVNGTSMLSEQSFAQAYYTATTTARYTFSGAVNPTININYTNINWLLDFSNTVKSFSIQNSAWTELLNLGDNDTNSTTLISNCASGLLTQTIAAAVGTPLAIPATANGPLFLNRVRGPVTTQILNTRVTHVTSASPSVTIQHSNYIYINGLRAEQFGGGAAILMDRSGTNVSTISIYNCDNFTADNMVSIGQTTISACLNTILNGFVFAGRLCGGQNSNTTISAITISGCNSTLINGYSHLDNLPNVAPYVSFFNLRGDDITICNIGSLSAPVYGGSELRSLVTNNTRLLITITATDLYKKLILRRVYTANFSNTQGLMSNFATSRNFKNCEFTDILANWETTYQTVSDNIIVRGALSTLAATAVNSCFDNIFKTQFVSYIAGHLVLTCNKTTSVYSSWVTLSGSAYFNTAGQLVLNTQNDTAIYEWPYTIYGFTAFTNTTATITGTNTGTIVQEYALKTTGSYGSWKSVTGANLSGESISPSTGFTIKFRFSNATALRNTALTDVAMSNYSVSMVTTRDAMANLYPAASEPTDLRGKITGVTINGDRYGIQGVALSNAPVTSTSSADWEPTVDPMTGREVYIRKHYTATSSSLLDVRVGDLYQV